MRRMNKVWNIKKTNMEEWKENNFILWLFGKKKKWKKEMLFISNLLFYPCITIFIIFMWE